MLRSDNPPLSSGFWRTHAWLPLIAFGIAWSVLEGFRLDPVIARSWFFDETTLHWLGTGPGDWWARDLLHTGGRWLVRGTAAAATAAWLLSFAHSKAHRWRSHAGFVALAMVASVTVVGALKAITNVDCPADLLGFGGHNPYVTLLADRLDTLTRARCFPGAHASSGFALVAFYFASRDQAPRFARWALAVALGVGVAFSVGQQARGAHFVSHDLSGAAIVWAIQLALYGRLRRRPEKSFAGDDGFGRAVTSK